MTNSLANGKPISIGSLTYLPLPDRVIFHPSIGLKMNCRS